MGDVEDRSKTVLITGGTGGLGALSAQAIHDAGGWRVIVAGRDRAAVAGVAARLGSGAEGCVFDLGSLHDVRRAAHQLPRLDALVCNAGVHHIAGTHRTEDGVEQTFGVNHLAHFLLIRATLPRMNPGARVVLVSSGTHDPSRRTGFPAPAVTTVRALAGGAMPADETSEFRAGRRRYTASKLCNVVTAYEFARRVAPAVATFNAVDPGQMPGTGIARDYRGPRGFGWRRILPVVAPVLRWTDLRTPRRSAAEVARLVTDPALAGVSGRYYADGRPMPSSAQSRDRAFGAELWRASVELIDELTAPGDAA